MFTRGEFIHRTAVASVTRRVMAVLIVGGLLHTLAAEDEVNAIKNGDFEKGSTSWELGTGVRVITVQEKAEDGSIKTNKVCEIPLRKDHDNRIITSVAMAKKTKELSVSLRVKPSENFESALPDGDQMSLRLYYSKGSKGSSFIACKIKPNGQWQNITRTFQCSVLQDVSLRIDILPGSGRVWVDDVVVKCHQLVKTGQ
jgi:hypothetical protein